MAVPVSKLWRKLVWRCLLFLVLGVSLAFAMHGGIVSLGEAYGPLPEWVRQGIWLLGVVLLWVMFAVLVVRPFGELKAAKRIRT
jgi:hypothetical protein